MLRSMVVGAVLLGLVSSACAETPQEEIQAEAQRIKQQAFTQCGEDYFAKKPRWRLPSLGPLSPGGPGWKTKEEAEHFDVYHFKDLNMHVREIPLSPADLLNGFAWKVHVVFGASVQRKWTVLTDRPLREGWTPWEDVRDRHATFYRQKQQGQISDPIPLMSSQLRALACTEIPD